MKKALRNLLIRKINASEWWHVKPSDPKAYDERGKFLASTYLQAEFYGKPNLGSECVHILNPVVGCSEYEILRQLFGMRAKALFQSVTEERGDWYRRRVRLDGLMYHKAKELGFDSIVLISDSGKRELQVGRKPGSIELNLLNL